MWLARVLKRLHAHPGPILLEGGEAYGAPYLIEALAKTQHVAWVELTPADANDPVAINNRFADALNGALRMNLLPHALPFAYSLEVLRSRLPLLEPLTIACTNADYNLAFRDALLDLSQLGVKVIVIVAKTVLSFPAGLHLTQTELALTHDEAANLAGPYLTETERDLLWRSSGGAYVPFMHSVYRLADQALPRVPSPRGDLTPEDESQLVSPDTLLEVLLRLGRYVEALDLAVMSLPERVAEFIEEAGQDYLARGLLARLHLLLESLDEPFQRGEKMLEWRLVAAYSQNEHPRLLPLITDYLQENEAPELRARFAATLTNPVERLEHAQRAAAAKATPFTLFQLGSLHPDDREGSTILRQSVRLAEQHGRVSDIARNASALSESLVYLGKFQEAAAWSTWALQQFEQAGLRDGTSRLRLLDAYATTSLLLEQRDDLRDILQEAKDALEHSTLSAATDFRAILADLELAEGNLSEAEALATTNYAQSPRWNMGRYAVRLVLILLKQGKTTEALAKAQHAYTLTKDEAPYYALPTALALGMACMASHPERARELLLGVLQENTLEATLRVSAALHLLKLNALKLSEVESALQETLTTLTPTAFRLFSGPEEAFAEVWNTLSNRQSKLRIRALGREEVWLGGKRLELSGRSLEVLVLLALHPEGLSAEALHAKLYSDDATKLVALRSAVSRLRTLVPISSYPDSYKITVPFEFDAGACEAALEASQVRQALEHYQGALLTSSDAPGIREAREALEERLRQCVLQTGDTQLLLLLAETLKDDLEIWQLLHATLPAGDTRQPIVKAQLLRVTREMRPYYN